MVDDALTVLSLKNCSANAAITSPMPIRSAMAVGYTSAKPAARNITRSMKLVRFSAQPWKPAASAATPSAAVKLTSAIDHQFALASALLEPISN